MVFNFSQFQCEKKKKGNGKIRLDFLKTPFLIYVFISVVIVMLISFRVIRISLNFSINN